jgi:hypothetical protein
MNLQSAPDPREVYFFCLCAAGNLLKKKRYRVWAGTMFTMKWDGAARNIIMSYELVVIGF